MSLAYFFPFIQAAGMFCLSLGGAYVLFRFLKSTALITGEKWQAGGALAGFVIIFALLAKISSQISHDACTIVNWTVSGYVEQEDVPSQDVIHVSQETNTAQGTVNSDGQFTLTGASVLKLAPNPYPTVHFAGDDAHIGTTYPIDKTDATIDDMTSRITLKKTVLLPHRSPSQIGSGRLGK